jgi:hypothetical protein
VVEQISNDERVADAAVTVAAAAATDIYQLFFPPHFCPKFLIVFSREKNAPAALSPGQCAAHAGIET